MADRVEKLPKMSDERFKELAAQEDGCIVSAGSPPLDYAKRNAEFMPDWGGMPADPRLAKIPIMKMDGRDWILLSDVRAALALPAEPPKVGIQMNAGELDGESLIDMNNLAVGYHVPKSAGASATPAPSEIPKMGPGDYSCATCGMGMVEPCIHWRESAEAYAKLGPSATTWTDEIE